MRLDVFKFEMYVLTFYLYLLDLSMEITKIGEDVFWNYSNCSQTPKLEEVHMDVIFFISHYLDVHGS